MVEFLLAHAEVLRKMAIHVQEEATPDAETRFRDQVLEYPRASEACQAEIISTKKNGKSKDQIIFQNSCSSVDSAISEYVSSHFSLLRIGL